MHDKEMLSEEWKLMNENVLKLEYPMHRACRDGDLDALAKLLSDENPSNFHVNLEDTYYGWTPAHWAAYFGKIDCLRIIIFGIGNGVCTSVDIRTSRFSQTPAHIAAFAGHPQCLQWLHQAGADLNVKDYLGETPLHKAARTGYVECVSFLVANNADIRVANSSNRTAEQLAKLCGHTELSRYLQEFDTKEAKTPVTALPVSLPHLSSNGYYGFLPLKTSSGSSMQTDVCSGQSFLEAVSATTTLVNCSDVDVQMSEEDMGSASEGASFGCKRTMEDVCDSDSKRRRTADCGGCSSLDLPDSSWLQGGCLQSTALSTGEAVRRANGRIQNNMLCML